MTYKLIKYKRWHYYIESSIGVIIAQIVQRPDRQWALYDMSLQALTNNLFAKKDEALDFYRDRVKK